MRLLLVEDDMMIGEALANLLRGEGYAVDWAHDGIAADTALRAQDYDAILLDLGLPRRSGLDVLKAARARGCNVPVLIATARDAIEDRVAGLDAGADDYLLKPFDFSELLARVRALVRRAAGHGQSRYVHGDVVLDPVRREASVGGERVVLSAREWAVLEALIVRPGQTLSRQQIEDKLYGWGTEIASNAIEVYIHGLRRKLGPDFIRTERGLGYQVPVP
ncbi:MAG: response regulator [Lysobacter sp.]|nr:MAG: response regulator [Lysobacter sp.]